MLTSVQRSITELNPINYPFSKTRNRNVLKDLNCEAGGFNPCGSSLKVLFLGSGDLKNAIQIAENKSFKSMQIHLTDLDTSVVARNITILKIISASGFNPEDDEDIAFLWDVWYNLEWPEVTRKRFQGILKDLLNGVFPENVSVPKTSQAEMLKKVWSAWLSFLSKTESEASVLMEEFGSERKKSYIRKLRNHRNHGEMENTNIDDLFSKVIDELASNLERSIGLERLDDSTRQNIREEAKRYFERGSCRLENDIKIVCLNPTMFDHATSLYWTLCYSLCPFDGYLTLVEEELDILIKSKMMIRSCQKILKNLLSFYRKRLNDGKTFELFFYLEDALEFCYSENVNKFDIIDCSNVADHVGLANLILACSGKLSDHPSAMLFTESLKWLDFKSVKLYLEKVLCCPLSMIPTIYGLRLKSRIELGLPEYVDLRRPTSPPVNLCWQKALPFRNVVMSPSSVLDGFLNKLANVCFDAKFPLRITGVPPGSECGMLLYTPQTFSYVVNSMIQRLGGDHWLKKDFRRAEMHPNFQLARRTLDAWKDGQKILKLSAKIPSSSFNNFLLCAAVSGIPIPRLIFLPKAKHGNCYDFFGPDVHFIDNFQLKLEKSSTGFQDVSISFLLIPHHGLEKTHRAIIVDIPDGSEVVVFESFESVKVEDWSFPYPFISKKIELEVPSPEEFHMKVDSCVESEDQFCLKINITSPINVSGIKVTTNHRAPCESCHEITLSLNPPENFKPLSLSFPYPILADDIRATLNLKSRRVDLMLKKALWEPWPCEYQPADDLHNVIDPDQLKPWKEEESLQPSLANRNLNFLENHIRSQFNINNLENILLMEESSLNFVRFVIKDLFMDPCRPRYVTIQLMNAPTPDWFFLVHRPVSTTPTGRPFLLLSAFDFRLAEKLAADGKWSQKKTAENFKRVFPGDKKTMTIPIQTTEDSKLLRFVLRLNRSKITPSTWQKKNLTLGEDSPWMATFVSPLYNDNSHLEVESSDDSDRSTLGRTADDNNCCAACKKVSQSLKRCSRCRSTVYCSVECQRQHWAQHKMDCKKV